MHLNPWKRISPLVVAVIAVVTASRPRAEPVPIGTRVVVAVDGIKAVRNLPAILAERLGYFKAEGLNVTLMEVREDVPTDQLLTDGRADAAVAFYHHTILSQAEGKSTEAVLTMGGSPGLKLLVAARLADQVHTVADLQGRRIFTGGPNSGKTTAANWLFLHAGLKTTDYAGLALRPRDEMARALKDGGADAIVAHEPDATFYRRAGVAVVIADLTSVEETRRNLGSLFPSTALYLATEFVGRHPALTQKLVNALYRSQQYIKDHRAEELLKILPPEFAGKAGERSVYANDVKEDMQMFATDGRLDPTAAEAEMKAMANYAKKFTHIDLAATYTNDFVAEAEKVDGAKR